MCSADVNPTDEVTITARVFKHNANASTTFVCFADVESCQKIRKAASKDDSVLYLTTKPKKVGALVRGRPQL